MSCGCTNSNVDCGASATPTNGVKISQLNPITSLMDNDIFVVVNSAANETNNITFAEIESAIDHTVIQNIGIYSHDDIDVHINDSSIHYPMSAIDGLAPAGGSVGQTLAKVSSADYDYAWSDSGIGDMQKSVYDTNDNGIVDDSERFGGEFPSYYATSADLSLKENYLGLPVSDGQILSTSGSGIRYWIDYNNGDVTGPISAVDLNIAVYDGTTGKLIRDGGSSISQINSSINSVAGDLSSHESDSTIHYPVSAIDGLNPSGGSTGDVLTKNSNTDYDYSWSQPYGAGDTASRPVSPGLGFPYFDTDLGYQINYNGTDWVNATGAIV